MSKYVKPEVEEITVKCPDIMSRSIQVGLNVSSNTMFDPTESEPSEVKVFSALDWSETIY